MSTKTMPAMANPLLGNSVSPGLDWSAQYHLFACRGRFAGASFSLCPARSNDRSPDLARDAHAPFTKDSVSAVATKPQAREAAITSGKEVVKCEPRHTIHDGRSLPSQVRQAMRSEP